VIYPAIEFIGANDVSCSRINRYGVIFTALEFTGANDFSCSKINR